ncbi:MAG TPA: NYN domain-containing protein [bacterium]|nr:NYN domain-containing protein [bacterium]
MYRVIAYIDGYNLYYGLKSKGWKRFYWLNLVELVRSLLKPEQSFAGVKYFTALVSDPPDKRKRQSTYIEAIQTVKGIKVYYGKFLAHKKACRKCGYEHIVQSEKMTDVNIATELLVDAFQDKFDIALVISADSDLSSPITRVKQEFPGKRVIAVFPPARHSIELQKIATGCFTLGRAKLLDAQFPDEVTKADGFVLKRPREWS